MFKRVIASCLFLVGGLVVGAVLLLLQGFGASQAGMSAGTGSGAGGSEAAVLLLFCSYFMVSAVSAMAAKKKQALWILWGIAHALVAIGFLVLCSEASGWDREKLIQAVVTLAVIIAVLLLPWLAVWGWLLRNASPGTSPDNPTIPNSPDNP
jgi:hypothetical protein